MTAPSAQKQLIDCITLVVEVVAQVDDLGDPDQAILGRHVDLDLVLYRLRHEYSIQLAREHLARAQTMTQLYNAALRHSTGDPKALAVGSVVLAHRKKQLAAKRRDHVPLLVFRGGEPAMSVYPYDR